MYFFFFFFFKQKTAYEMRISDWSSDVCSSDLAGLVQDHAIRGRLNIASPSDIAIHRHYGGKIRLRPTGLRPPPAAYRQIPRSEEHPSELQSLMRISYAVFCLKKKRRDGYNSMILITTALRTNRNTKN